ncbi:leucine-rich repeat-containing protein 74B-like [Ylistrum balloti]|uniref:leucine-rich repeat-containing protein 74B-like n=1 Tax=Ylistrum balloti TaxID=509963 RepID=UPI002905B876|nr:leucine-rich repeat-containing protein 74B-like [Ylistrum balloti]
MLKTYLRKLNSLPLICRHVIPRKTRLIQRRKTEDCPMLLPPLSIDKSDSDEELNFSEDSDTLTPEPRPPELTGINVYLAACKKYNLDPMSAFQRQLSGEIVSLRNQNIRGKTAKAMALALVANHSVSSIDLGGSDLGQTGIAYLAEVLNDNANITEMNLSGSKLMSRGLQIIAEVMRENRTLRSLDLSDNGFTEKDATYLKDLLKSRCILRHLNLSKNTFEESGGVLIAQGLAENTTLRVLNLSWNHLRGKGASAIGISLTTNDMIEVLDISWNGFDMYACHSLGQGLDKNSSLRELDISSNRISPSGIAKVLEGLEHNTTLTILKLACNPLGPEGALAVLKASLNSRNISELDFGNQPVSVEFVDLLTKFQFHRDVKVYYGKVLCKVKPEVCDDTMYIPGNPLMILFEFIRMKKLDILDVFKTLDADRDHSITWGEFRIGIKKSHIPVRSRDLEQLIRTMDLNKDGEISFSELVVAQKSHNTRAEKLLAVSQDAFYDSTIGQIHRDLQTFCNDTNVFLKRYKLLE